MRILRLDEIVKGEVLFIKITRNGKTVKNPVKVLSVKDTEIYTTGLRFSIGDKSSYLQLKQDDEIELIFAKNGSYVWKISERESLFKENIFIYKFVVTEVTAVLENQRDSFRVPLKSVLDVTETITSESRLKELNESIEEDKKRGIENPVKIRKISNGYVANYSVLAQDISTNGIAVVSNLKISEGIKFNTVLKTNKYGNVSFSCIVVNSRKSKTDENANVYGCTMSLDGKNQSILNKVIVDLQLNRNQLSDIL